MGDVLGGVQGPCDAGDHHGPTQAAAPGPLSSKAESAPCVRNDLPRGDLDKEIIRRIIRRHINEVKACYEPELLKQPKLGGRIMVRFTIAASGLVIASVLESSTMDNARVETCTVQAVRRWQFPQPLGGGIVVVTYPFTLTPSPHGAE